MPILPGFWIGAGMQSIGKDDKNMLNGKSIPYIENATRSSFRVALFLVFQALQGRRNRPVLR